MSFDSRRIPARPDLAAAHLKGKIEAESYAEAKAMRVSVPLAPLTMRPDGEAMLATQLLYGESFEAYEQDGAWAWGQSAIDGYVGYVPGACLEPAGPEPTHRVALPMTHVYPEPALKTRPIGWLSYGALVRAEGAEAGFAALATGGFVPAQHLAPRAAPAADWVAEALRFLGAPYLWGGRSAAGLDCSALVQLARQAAGFDCPRDSDMQREELGETLAEGAAPARGDLMFWKGHIGVMLDATRMLHANAHHMACAIEPLEGARARILAIGEGPVLRHARLDAGDSGR
ncbi:MAG TPA: NlpC/P60 family protein [Thermohalobaculum sp.]|nr:NlpC/P60 family protein [Thermohalobaculum sp.]